MVQKILIFNIFLLLFLLSSNILNAKTITGKANIIDGDTIHINNNKIRLHGIDAPERNQKCVIQKNEWTCGKQATIELKKLINNQVVRCTITDIDIYNRFVAVCLIDTIDINKWMVKNGWAIAYRYYSSDYISEEEFAREQKLGIWKSKFIQPYLYRKQIKN